MRTIGIVAHSIEGASLCFVTACQTDRLGDFLHPPVVLSAVPMGLSMPGWEAGDHDAVAPHLLKGIEMVAAGGANFYVCPDNTAHIVLEHIAGRTPIPGLHIAACVCDRAAIRGWTRVGLLGTQWTMNGPVYQRALAKRGMEALIPDEATQKAIHAAIFDELCHGVFKETTTRVFVDAIESLRARGAEAVVLGCTEIPLIIHDRNSPLPVLDSTRLLAHAAVDLALDPRPLHTLDGWVQRRE